MNGFLSGAAGALTVILALALAAAVVRRRVRRHFYGTHFGIRRVLRRIGARPEQERLVLAETDALAEELRAVRRDAAALRDDLALLFAAPAIDAASVSSALNARLAGLGRLGSRGAEALARIHAALDTEQRARLASLVREGPRHRCAHA